MVTVIRIRYRGQWQKIRIYVLFARVKFIQGVFDTVRRELLLLLHGVNIFLRFSVML